MKQCVRTVYGIVAICLIATGWVNAQKVDEDRMERDIEVAENVLSTMVKRELGVEKLLFPFAVEGKYLPGFGVTLRLPVNFSSNWVMLTEEVKGPVVVGEGTTYSYTYSNDCEDCEKVVARSSAKMKNTFTRDSINYQRVIQASKQFLADYGDLISQLAPEERVMITNRGDNDRFYFPGIANQKRSLVTVEATKADMTQVRQGKLSREQFLSKVKVVNTTSAEETDPDLELLSSIFSRLYRVDLSKTYYTNENVYFERLKDFGAIFYMTVYSSEETDYKKWRMPTQNTDNMDQAARDKKVTELYPLFEKDIKENLLEYGRTVRSLKDNESITVNIRLTKCKDCGIPSTLELAVKNDVIKQFNTGQLSKEAALAKISVKKGPAQ